MPIDYVVLDRGSLVYARVYGTVTDQDLVMHESALLADPRVVRGYRQLLDCRWVTEDKVTDGVLIKVAQVHKRGGRKLRGARYALIAPNARWFDLGLEYQCDVYGMTLIVFNDPSTACIWLGTDSEVIRRQSAALYRREDVPAPPQYQIAPT